MDTPVFILAGKERTTKKSFDDATRNDIEATLKFLYKRGMWSKFHFKHWIAEVKNMDSEMLHLWWDAITTGAMFETESMVEERLEAMEEAEENKVEKEKCKKRRMNNLKMRK